MVGNYAVASNDATGLMQGTCQHPTPTTQKLELGGPRIPDILFNVAHQCMLDCVSAT
jgi:hypothetical protein